MRRLILILVLLTTGCAEVPGFRVVPRDFVDDRSADELPADPGAWGSLDAGEMPDVFVLAAWRDLPWDVYLNISDWEQEIEESRHGTDGWGLALVDLRGQVLAEYPVPDADPWEVCIEDLRAAAPGYALVVTRPTLCGLGNPASYQGFGAEATGWLLELETGVWTEAFETSLDYDGEEWVAERSLASGESLSFDGMTGYRVAPSRTDLGVLYFALNGGARQIARVHVGEGGIETWPLAQAYPAGVSIESMPRRLHAAVDDGRDLLLTVGSEYAEEPHFTVSAWSPDDGLLWTHTAPGSHPRTVAENGGAPALSSFSSTTWSEHLPDGTTRTEVPLAPKSYFSGPFFERSAGLHSVHELASSHEPWDGEAVTIYLGDREIHRVDRLRLGMTQIPVAFGEMAVVAPAN